MRKVPATPAWVRWAITRSLSPAEARLVMDELRELHSYWSEREGLGAADRRYLRQLRQYPFRLLLQRCRVWVAELPAVRALSEDLACGVRSLAKRPLFTAIGVTTIGLGIGATTLVFSVVSGVLFSPLPFADANELVGVFPLDSGNPGDMAVGASDLARYYGTDRSTYEGWKEANAVFSDMGAFRTPGFTVAGGSQPENLNGAYVDSGVFSTLRASPLLGRVILASDDRTGAPPVVVLSHGAWGRLLGGVSDAVGRSLSIGGVQHTVVGVMPPEFEFPTETEEIWANFVDQPRDASNLQVIARLAPDVSLDRAQRDMDIVAAAVGEMHPDDKRNAARVIPTRDLVVGDSGSQLFLLLASVGVVLLLACVNTATLLLVRSADRRRELGIRRALGAGRGRLIVQILSESVALSLVGGAVGCAIAVVGLDPFVAMFPDLPRAGELSVDPRMLMVATALALFAGVSSGLLPAARWSNVDVTGLLREGGRGATRGRAGGRTLAALVVAEIAMAFVLLHGAGLFVRSFQSLAAVDIGFQAEGVVTTRLRLPVEYRSSNDDIGAFYEDLLGRIAAIPGVQGVGAASQMPFTTGVSSADLTFSNTSGPVETTEHIVFATPGFFSTLGLALLSGRGFTWDDRSETESVALINRAMAERYFPGENPIGRPVGIVWDGSWTHTIVGVVDDVRYNLEATPFPAIYVPFVQRPTWYQSIVVRHSGDVVALSGALREAVWAMNATMPVDIARLDDVIADSRPIRSRRFSSTVVGWLAGVATLLAMIGIYGVLAAVVSQRRRDIGIRMALGATSRSVLGHVLGDALRLGLLGLGVGATLAWSLSRLIQNQLYDVSATDPTTLAAVGLLLASAVTLASYIPARRASRIDPIRSLGE